MNDGLGRTTTGAMLGTTVNVVRGGVPFASGWWCFTSYLSPAVLVGHEARMA
ncbi:MAG: hypothetical protein H0U40_10780 [Chloroflexia bacterium]|nr:hypothetical protein [Chloroflexia bacterium]